MSSDEDQLSEEASSVSWYMLDPPAKKQRKKQRHKVKLTKQQYECLMKLTRQARFSGSPFYWKLRGAPASWESLIAMPGNYFVVGVCWWWLGPLKFGMVAEDFEGVEELYSILMECSSLMGRRRSVARSSHEYHPYTFLKFSHVSDDVFEVSWSGSRVSGREGNKSSVVVTGQKGVYQRHLLERKEQEFTLRLQRLENEAMQCTRLTQVEGVPKMAPLGHKTSLKMEQMFLRALDRSCQSVCSEERVEQLEGVHSLSFQQELERSFATVSHQLQDEGETIDLEHLAKVMYSSSGRTAMESWTLNGSTFADIGNSLETFVRERGEILLQQKD